jgi:tetratricopeptide (TPR) repeat protein
MRRGWRDGLLVLALLGVPSTVVVGWWFHGPAHRERSLRAAADQALAADNPAGAEESLRELIRLEPKSKETRLRHATALRRLGRKNDAVDALARAMQLGLTKEEGLREFGLLFAEDDFPSAEGALNEVLKKDPGDAEVLEALTKGYAKQQRWREAEQACTRWLAVRPERTDVLLERATLRKENDQFADAVADCRELLRRQPEHYFARLLLAHCLMSEADLEAAEPELRRCRELRPDRPEPLIGLAACAVGREDYDGAQALVARALQLDPHSLPALLEQGDLYLRRQRYAEAVPLFEEVVRLYPRQKQGHLKLAQALRYTGKLEQAKRHELVYQELDREEEQRGARGVR